MQGICLISVAAVFVLVFLSLLAFCVEHGFRPDRQLVLLIKGLSPVRRLLLIAVVGILTIFAGTKDGDSTNAPPPRVSVIRRIVAVQPGVTISESETNLGYRVRAVQNTGGIVSPTQNAVTNEVWRLRGALTDVFRIGMDSVPIEEDWSQHSGLDFQFPWREDWSFGVTVFASGSFQPSAKDDFFPRPFATDLSLVPQGKWSEIADGGLQSLFWHELTPSNSLVLTWQNALYGRNANCPTNFQAELFDDGSFEYRYPDRTVSYEPVFPFDWDGDGLENTVDPEPLVAGTDAHGTNVEWYNTVCSNVFTAVEGVDGIELSPRQADVNTNAYYFVDVVTERGPAPIYFTADGESNLGNSVVIAKPGVTNHVPLLIGADYAITSSVPVRVFVPVEGNVQVTRHSSGSYNVLWPLRLHLVGTVSGSTCEYSLEVEPNNLSGQIIWGDDSDGILRNSAVLSSGCSCPCISYVGEHAYFTCGSHCNCGGLCRARGSFMLEGRMFPFQGGLCTCGGDHVSLQNENQTLSLSLSVPSCLLLRSAWMPGSRSASITFTAENLKDIDQDISVFVPVGINKLDSVLSSMQNFTVPAGQQITRSIAIDGVQQSDSIDDVAVFFSFGDIIGRKALTVVKPLRIEIPSAPASGLATLAGSAIPANLITTPQMDSLSVEWLTSRRKHRNQYDEWVSKGYGGVNASLMMQTPGIYALSAHVVCGTQSNAVEYVHVASENAIFLSGERKGPNKIGARNHIGVASTQLQLDIRNAALAQMGTTAYSFANYLNGRNGFQAIPENVWKCNAFAADAVIAGGGSVPVRTSFLGGVLGRSLPPLANEWANRSITISGWTLLNADAYPEPGFIVAFPNPSGSGHVGIVDYDGWSISAREHAVTRNAQKMLDSRCVYRKPIVNQE